MSKTTPRKITDEEGGWPTARLSVMVEAFLHTYDDGSMRYKYAEDAVFDALTDFHDSAFDLKDTVEEVAGCFMSAIKRYHGTR